MEIITSCLSHFAKQARPPGVAEEAVKTSYIQEVSNNGNPRATDLVVLEAAT
jgi:hypothetical protein